jgi:hypothetical protein
MLLHLLKLRVWPENDACNHWQGEVVGFQIEANRHFSPSMRQNIDVGGIYAHGLKRLRAEAPNIGFAPVNPFELDHLLQEDWETLLGRLPTACHTAFIF